ncbi:aminotransferase class I and II [Marinilongibacter aquaticus]|uniref:HipA family kinase n=1 Tax=Marinilongibacter aquaticus TaxID=2975157 RepID=UPI0021BD6FE3|nr:HipA family kinase [Marinilongibacter aquaticus]UBM59223.1 aminotransferase class I and II [Marinilongibacter aquaticus]
MAFNPEIREVNVLRYLIPLREGGSLPAIVEADDDFKYVLKFRGAGQGIKALIAELVGGELARALGLKLPEIVFANLDDRFGKVEPDEEIQDLLKASVGQNLGLHYLEGAKTFDPLVNQPDSALSSLIVWLDCFINNVDRTAKNTNLLMWHKELWLIDHGAAFYFHHTWDDWEARAQKPFLFVKDHCLLPFAANLDEANEKAKSMLDAEKIKTIVDLIPEEWLGLAESPFESPEAHREAYKVFLYTRLHHAENFVNAAKDARK